MNHGALHVYKIDLFWGKYVHTPRRAKLKIALFCAKQWQWVSIKLFLSHLENNKPPVPQVRIKLYHTSVAIDALSKLYISVGTHPLAWYEQQRRLYLYSYTEINNFEVPPGLLLVVRLVVSFSCLWIRKVGAEFYWTTLLKTRLPRLLKRGRISWPRIKFSWEIGFVLNFKFFEKNLWIMCIPRNFNVLSALFTQFY